VALYWQPRTAGSYSVRAIDDHGRVDQRSLQVDLIE
jgi:penicillin-binding protein 1C